MFATKLIPKETIIWIQDELDMVLDEDYIESLDEARQEYIYKCSYEDDDGYILCWDHARYMNHSFHYNCVDTAYGFELAELDEQLTCDYRAMGEDEEFECVPERGTSRTKLTANDYLTCYIEWDEKASKVFTYFNTVDQPLKHLIKAKFLNNVTAVANGTETARLHPSFVY
ncbi:SET domain-containing protein [Desulfuribacillus stibiiarsenatis]|uniref:SET domain-containing protein n=1 Tax=Desulfuribacillus stibiiarsenatis TaxID=1390249 RepID=UPI001FDEE86B|nr:SET domain-containing protein [Desulfuribacillus stibiiarsenatis]